MSNGTYFYQIKIKLKNYFLSKKFTLYTLRVNVTEPAIKPNKVYVPPKPIVEEFTFLISSVDRTGMLKMKIIARNFSGNLSEAIQTQDLNIILNTQDNIRVNFEIMNRTKTGDVIIQLKF